MNLKNKVYQMFMLAPQKSDLLSGGHLEYALKMGLGGVIFFTKNIFSIDQVKTFTAQIKEVALIKPFIGIDQEGGRVERTENIFNGKKFLSARIQAEKGLDCVKEQSEKIAKLIKDMGFNMNFAPVLDVNTNPNNPIIGERAYSTIVNEVEKYGICAMHEYQKNAIIPVCKHFPGHGDASIDSHLSLPTLDLDFSDVENIHIKPFKTAIDNGAIAIMVAHLYCTCFDEETTPSSLSNNVLSYLRNNMNFRGLIISDDMQMGALQSLSPTSAVIKGIKAGINLFLYRESTEQIIDIIESVYQQAQKDKDLEDCINNSFELVKKIKSCYDRIL